MSVIKNVLSRFGPAVALLAIGLSACGDDSGPQGTGQLRVTVVSGGDDLDDSFAVTVDGVPTGTVDGPDGVSTLTGIAAGSRSVGLADVAANCTVASNPRSVQVAGNATAETTFVVSCVRETGAVEVAVETSGVDPDDSYGVEVNSQAAVPVGGNDTVVVSAGTGTGNVELVDVASNCSVGPANPQSVDVLFADTVSVGFTVTCVSNVGGVTVEVTTAGNAPGDFDVTVDGAQAGTVAPNGNLTLDDVAAGERMIGLDGLGVCSVSGANPAPATVAFGDTVTVAFSVDCQANAGYIEVTSATTGFGFGSGYSVEVDGAPAGSLGNNDTAVFGPFDAGQSPVELLGISSDCSVTSGANPAPVDVVASDTVGVTFDVFCLQPLSGKIVFESNRLGSYRIFVMNTNGDSQQQLIPGDGGDDSEPAVSPDGASVAFESTRSGPVKLYVADRNGVRRLTGASGSEGSPSWSGNGQWVAYTRRTSGPYDIHSVRTDGSNLTNLTNSAADDEQPAWSRDGTMILFRSNRDGNDEIYVMDADGQNQVRLTNDPGGDGKPAWSPDGTQITWSSDRGGNFDVWRADFDSGSRTLSNLIPLTNGGAVDGKSDWRPSGGRIAYSSDAGGDNEIILVNPDGSGTQQLTNNTADDLEPSWSP
jgi:Tol biopolymer transport system component